MSLPLLMHLLGSDDPAMCMTKHTHVKCYAWLNVLVMGTLGVLKPYVLIHSSLIHTYSCMASFNSASLLCSRFDCNETCLTLFLVEAEMNFDFSSGIVIYNT